MGDLSVGFRLSSMELKCNCVLVTGRSSLAASSLDLENSAAIASMRLTDTPTVSHFGLEAIYEVGWMRGIKRNDSNGTLSFSVSTFQLT